MVILLRNNFEKFECCIFIIFIVIFIEFLFVVCLFKINLNIYKTYNCVVIKDDLVYLFIDKDDLKLFNSNSYIYYKNKKCRFEIIEVQRNLTKKYHEIVIKFKFKNKSYDSINISIFKKKVKLIHLFDVIWKEAYIE